MLSEQVLTRWRRLVAFMKALDLLHRAMCTVEYHHIAMAKETAIKVSTYYNFVLFAVALAAANGKIQQ
jgi:hypothetical protein